MWWQYLSVFVGAFLFDAVPFPFPPAFTIMIFLQLTFHLDIWWVIILGVFGSILGRYVVTLYIPYFAAKIFNPYKNQDVQFLGRKMKEKGWKSQAVILTYSLLPLPTTPLFVAGGMAKINPLLIIPAFFIGKFTSDSIMLHLGQYASENTAAILNDALSWKSIVSLSIGLLFLCTLLFIDWRSLIQKKKFQLNFKIWR